jgi:hypothetical protein
VDIGIDIISIAMADPMSIVGVVAVAVHAVVKAKEFAEGI